jgi:osmotically-inducible protein OsmY
MIYLKGNSGLRATGFLAAIAVAGLTACGETQVRENTEEQTLPVAQTETADEPLADADIAEAINRELSIARGIPFAAIDVEVNDGIVTLSGSVDNILAKDRTERIASMVRGVRSIVNTIEVVPSGRSDTQMTTDVLAALAADPATEAWQIDPVVTDGIVTLTGTTDSWQEKQLAAKVVKGVAGVRGVENNITVSYDVTRPETEIQEEIERKLQWDARVDATLIDVSVEDDTVILSGTVGSAYEKSIATADAYVVGVQAVETEPLEVEWWARDEMRRKEIYVDKTDDAIQDAVSDALLYDPRVASFNIDVAVDEGRVTLAGEVDNPKAKQAAAQDASNTAGVWKVENNLEVIPEAERPSREVVTNVNEALQRDPYLESEEVNVSVEDGIVTLAGEVESYFEKWQASDVALRAQGVVAVDNNLVVNYEPLDYETSFYDWDPTLYDYDYEIESKSDAAIAEDLQDEIFWSPYVEPEEVSFTVEDGVATLTGEVDTWYERTRATEEAYEAGAVAVVNGIQVEDGSDLEAEAPAS